MDTRSQTRQRVVTENLSGERLVRTLATAAYDAKVVKEEAKDAFDAAEADTVDAMCDTAITSVVLRDGTKVTLRGGLEGESTRSVDYEALAAAVDADTLARVLADPKVDLKRFDAAVEVGLISPEVVSAVVALNPRKGTLIFTAPKR